jgi:hypothetical protein
LLPEYRGPSVVLNNYFARVKAANLLTIRPLDFFK